MPILAKDNRREFNPAPEGLHQAVCIDVIDLGLVKSQWGEKHQVEIRWQLETLDDQTGLPFMVLRRYTLSLNEKAKLRHHLEAWRGRKFTSAELEGFDLEKLLGVNCQIQIVHDIADDGRTWANVSAVVPLGKGMVKIVPSDTYVRVVDRNQTGNGATAPAADEVPF